MQRIALMLLVFLEMIIAYVIGSLIAILYQEASKTINVPSNILEFILMMLVGFLFASFAAVLIHVRRR